MEREEEGRGKEESGVEWGVRDGGRENYCTEWTGNQYEAQVLLNFRPDYFQKFTDQSSFSIWIS